MQYHATSWCAGLPCCIATAPLSELITQMRPTMPLGSLSAQFASVVCGILCLPTCMYCGWLVVLDMCTELVLAPLALCTPPSFTPCSYSLEPPWDVTRAIASLD